MIHQRRVNIVLGGNRLLFPNSASLRNAFFLIGIALASGCGTQPQAPALRNEPVYQNDREGFRFLVPEGWAQLASGTPPPGPLPKDFMLTRYMNKGGDKRATFEVSEVDMPASADVAAYLAGPSHGVKQWQKTGAVDQVQSNGFSGERFTFSGRAGKNDLTKEVVVFRRGDRVYLFTGLYTPKDASARDQIRQAVASTIWKN